MRWFYLDECMLLLSYLVFRVLYCNNRKECSSYLWFTCFILSMFYIVILKSTVMMMWICVRILVQPYSPFGLRDREKGVEQSRVEDSNLAQK